MERSTVKSSVAHAAEPSPTPSSSSVVTRAFPCRNRSCHAQANLGGDGAPSGDGLGPSGIVLTSTATPQS